MNDENISQLERLASTSESREELGAWAIVAGLVFEIGIALAVTFGFENKLVEHWSAVFATALIAGGVYSAAHKALRTISDDKVAEAVANAARAHERAAFLEKEAARLKIKRAKRHLVELADAAEKLPGRSVYDCAVSKPEPRKLEIAFTTVNGMPIEFAGTLGDAVHNIRSAFDYIAIVLASSPLGTGNPKNIYFPTGVDREEFIKTRDGDPNAKGNRRHGKMKGARPEALRLVEELEPYGGGKHSIRELHDLDVMDKHKLLIPAVSLLSVRRMDITVDGKDITLGRADFQSNEDGTNITAVIECPNEVGNIKIKQEFDPAFEIVFGKGQPLDGKPIVPTLLQLTDIAESFIKSCEIAFRLV